MKKVRAQIWISQSSDRGQLSRPCWIEYEVNPIGSKTLYGIHRIVDARTMVIYDLESTLSINDNMDATIAAADPKQVAFARRELHIDLKNPPKKKPVKKKPIQSTETNDLLEGL